MRPGELMVVWLDIAGPSPCSPDGALFATELVAGPGPCSPAWRNIMQHCQTPCQQLLATALQPDPGTAQHYVESDMAGLGPGSPDGATRTLHNLHNSLPL